MGREIYCVGEMFINERERQKERSYLKGLISVVDPVHIGQQRGIEKSRDLLLNKICFLTFCVCFFFNEKNFSSLGVNCPGHFFCMRVL